MVGEDTNHGCEKKGGSPLLFSAGFYYISLMNKNDLSYQIALTLVPNVGCVQARILIEKLGDARTLFRTGKKALEKIVGAASAENILSFNDFEHVEAEMEFIEKYNIEPLFITDTAYPQRLLNCYDPPILLYYKGNANLNTSKVISIIGTRSNTMYGKQMTKELVQDLSNSGILIVSGLATGIDSIAHRNALRQGLNTVGVLAHGMDHIYPSQHKELAKDMILQGGLLTEFGCNSRPDKRKFPTRNRIVAGMSDATIVIETDAKGGSMITAEIAYSYNRDVFAYPGKTTDIKSTGCNNLIKMNKAVLLTDAAQLLKDMGWGEINNAQEETQQEEENFTELSPGEKMIIELLREKGAVHIDELNVKSKLSTSTVAAAILNLELLNLVMSLPGKLYKLV